jgi:Transposase IS200 like.
MNQGRTVFSHVMEFKTLSKTFWGRHMSRGYFVASSGNVTDEVIMKYIEQQSLEPPDGDFKVDGEL